MAIFLIGLATDIQLYTGTIKFNVLLITTLVVLLICCQTPLQDTVSQHDCNPPNEVLCFPGASGYGKWTKGGRSGKVIKVTNLQDDGPGSLRAALESEYPRTILFDTSGIIELKRSLYIRHPFVTIAGQSAPGGGITLKGADLIVQTSEVIIRGLRIRVGATHGEDYDGLALVTLQNNPVNNVIIDHCSISWAVDENISTNGRYAPISQVTFSNNIISEGLNDPSLHPKNVPHSMGMLLNKSGVNKVSVVQNLFAHNRDRQPKIGADIDATIINNVIYNWENKATDVAGGVRANIIGNYYKEGPSWNRRYKPITISDEKHETVGSLYIKDNFGPTYFSSEYDWDLVSDAEISWKSDTPVVNYLNPVLSHRDAYKLVLECSGAVPRDEIDSRIVLNVKEGTGSIILSPDEVGGYVRTVAGSPRSDMDGDGIPDWLEDQNGLDPENPNDVNQDLDCDGYTNIEEYLNMLIQAKH
jgi:hypothetical protein